MLFRFKQNLNPASPVLGELQERLPLMAAVDQMHRYVREGNAGVRVPCLSTRL